MAYTPPVGGTNPYVNHSGNPLRAKAAAAPMLLPQTAPLQPSPGGLRARDVKAVVFETPAGRVVEYNSAAAPAIRNANPPAPHGGGTYAFAKR